MPVIKVWCLPDITEEKLRELHHGIVKATESVEALRLNGEQSMTVLFPEDKMKYGLGTDIIVEVGWLFVKPERTLDVRRELVRNLYRIVKKFFPNAKVECGEESLDREKQGFWSSEEDEAFENS